jgi:ribosomal-protein-alanine N-acetyltransferase
MNPPETIDLPRLRLRRPAPSDAEAIFEYGSDPEVARYADWPVRTSIDGLAESLQGRAKRWESGADFYWVITRTGEGRAIGGISCCINQDSAEVGFLLHRRHWGVGFATEAARAVVAWVLSLPSMRRVWATCDAENLASARVLEKIGFSLEAALPRSVVRPNLSSEPRDALMYSIVKPVA